MTIPISSPPTNHPRANRFRPVASAQDPRLAPTYVEQFLLDVPPRVISNEVTLPFQLIAPFDSNAPARIVQILQLTLPLPMPVAVTLGAYSNLGDQFRGPARFNAENDAGIAALPTARYIVEWGMGEARNYLFTDLAPGSIQLPSAQYVSVSAHAYGATAAAGATLLPGALLGNPSATYTQFVQRDVDDIVTAFVQPYAREAAFHVYFDSTAGNDIDAMQARIRLNSILSTLGEYLIPAPTRANVSVRPQSAFALPLPGGCDRYHLALENIVAASGGPIATTTVVQTVRL